MVKKSSTCQQNYRQQQQEPMKARNASQYPFQMVGSDLLNGMVKILYWWLITTADVGTLRSFTKQILQQF